MERMQLTGLVAIVLLTASLAGCAAPEGDTVVVGTEAAFPPFEDLTPQGEFVGFDIDVMREIADRAGFEVTFQNAQFTAIIPSIQSGQLDAGISAFTITDERKRSVDFSIPYYDNELLVAVRADTDDIQEEGDLAGRQVCTQTGTTSETWLRQNVGASNDTMLLFDAFPPCAEALKRGDVDAMLMDRAVVRSLVEGSGGALKTAFLIAVGEQYGIAVAKDNGELLDRINTALSAMRADGTLEALKDKWQV